MNIRTAPKAKAEGAAAAHKGTGAKAAAPAQKKKNETGLPDTLKSGLEALSGHSMDDVQVHLNSSKPAQLQAHAYAQGNHIHVAPGQEGHLPHEAWHVVQQKQNRVKSTHTQAGVAINDDKSLEHEADRMGAQAMQMKSFAEDQSLKEPAAMNTGSLPVQRVGGKGDDGGDGGEKDKQLVLRGNVEANLNLLSGVMDKLPEDIQAFLLRLYSQLTGKKIKSKKKELLVLGSKDDEDALAPIDMRMGPESDNPLMRILSLNPRIIQNVVMGLHFMPPEQQRSLSTMRVPQLLSLFQQLATTKYKMAPPLLSAPVNGEVTSSTGAEHIRSSCYAASLLNIIAANMGYRNLFNPLVNITPLNGNARRLQNGISPLAEIIAHGGTVTAAQMERLITLLNNLGLLNDDGEGEAITDQQQDASQVLMGILNIVRPAHPLTTRETRQYDDQSPTRVQNESEFVLQLYAHGYHNLEQALHAHFVNNLHVTQNDDGDIADPHRLTRVITSFPDILTIGMARAGEYDSIDMPRQFTVPGEITHNGQPGPTYRLTAFVVRNTVSHLSGGHYIAVMRATDHSWYESDDMGTPQEDGVWSPLTQGITPESHHVGNQHAPSFAMATLYTYQRLQPDEVQQGGNRISFRSTWMVEHPTLADLLYKSKLPHDKLKEREKIVSDFLANDGNIWDAFRYMEDYPDDNAKLKIKFAERDESGLAISYTPEEANDRMVKGLMAGFASMSVSELLRLQTDTEKALATAPNEKKKFLRQQMIAIDLALKNARKAIKGDYKKVVGGKTSKGMSVEIFATDNVSKHKSQVDSWCMGVHTGLMQAEFLQQRFPPLQIRIYLRPKVTKEIANTRSSGNIININMDDYQPLEFSVGESLGLISHELGVHSLDNTTLTPKEMEDEAKDHKSKQKGKHGKETRTVVSNPSLKKQQTDHLTIGRGVLGQVSAMPRLNMYESTMLSILAATKSPKDKKEIAAAYAIDIARIIYLNDDPTEITEANPIKQVYMGNQIANTAVTEWKRIQKKYKSQYPEIAEIEISWSDIIGYVWRLKGIVEKVNKKK